MTINHDKKLTSFFNMPIKEVTPMRAKPDMVSFKTFVKRNEKLNGQIPPHDLSTE